MKKDRNMDTLILEGSDLTHTISENEDITQNAMPFPHDVFRLFVYNYERWLYDALKLEGRKRNICHTEKHVLYPFEGATLYIRKKQDFMNLVRDLTLAFIPFDAGLLDALRVRLWDEEDTFVEMNVTSIQKDENGFQVQYTHPSGEDLCVSNDELGDDEIMNLLQALIENNGGRMAKIPMKATETKTDMTIMSAGPENETEQIQLNGPGDEFAGMDDFLSESIPDADF